MPQSLSPFFDDKAAGPGRDHHIAQRVHGAQPLHVDQEEAVDIGDQLDLALLRLGGVHVLAHAQIAQDLRRLVLVEHVLVVLPNIDMVLAHAQQHRHVLRPDDVSLAEDRPLFLVLDDLGDVVAEHMPDGFFGLHQLHGCGFLS